MTIKDIERHDATVGAIMAQGYEMLRRKTVYFYEAPLVPTYETVEIGSDPRVRVETIDGIERVIIQSKMNE